MFFRLAGAVLLGLGLTLFIPPGAGWARPDDGYYRKLEKACKRKGHQLVSCCLDSVRLMREQGATLNSGGKNCSTLKCKGSYRWCKPVARRATRRTTRRATRRCKWRPKLPHENKKRIRIFFSERVIGESGVVQQDAGKVQTDGRTTADHLFRIKLERGRRGCRKGDPRAGVRRAAVMLGDEVVAELKALPGNCWQRVSRYLGDGQEPQGKRLVIKGWGNKGGVVRAWLDAYPRSAGDPPRPRVRIVPPLKPKPQVVLLPKVKVALGPSGKVDRTLGPFDIPGLDRERVWYATAFKVPNVHGKACGNDDKPIMVRKVELILNGKSRGGPTKIHTRCGFEEHWDLGLKLKERGNLMRVVAEGEPGGWFTAWFTSRPRSSFPSRR